MKSWRPFACLLPALLLVACGKPEPLRIAYLGELSGPSADVGEAARNGTLMAIEQLKDGLPKDGRPLEILVRDIGQTPESARQAAEKLVASRPEVIIGPTTSGLADAILPIIEAARIVLISPTASAAKFKGKDDYFFRTNLTTRENTQHYAEHYFAKGLKRVAVAVNENNRTFSESWLNEFRGAYQAIGGQISAVVYFDSTAEDLTPIVKQLLLPDVDALLLIANAVDTARLAQQAHKQQPALPLIAAEWAGTDQLIELGGKAVEQLMIVQNFNRDDDSPRYTAFKESYVRRYGKEPVYGSILAYDAAAAVMEALSRRPPGTPVKQALLSLGPFSGLQQEISFDAFGDTRRTAHFIVIRNGRFVREP